MRVGVVGVGHLGKHHARIYAEMPGVELVGVVDRLPDRAREIATAHGTTPFTDYVDILDKVDAVSLAVPTTDHAAIGVDLLNHGIHVLVEKPIAPTIEQGEALVQAAARNARILQVGHVERFNPVVRLALTHATEPQFFEVHRLATFSPRSLDVDVVLDLMIHDIDIVLTMVRSEVREVRAAGIPVLSNRADIANARVEFENGCVANFTASRVSSEKVRKLRFFQPHDYISIDYGSQQGAMVSLRAGRVGQRKLEPEQGEPLKIELESFVDACRTGAPRPVTGEEGVRALALALRIHEVMLEHARRTSLISAGPAGV